MSKRPNRPAAIDVHRRPPQKFALCEVLPDIRFLSEAYVLQQFSGA